ncbi:tape measure protein [Bacillus phage Stahl]|uniref:Tape measure protein n=1 Tax=Bacillus phage Stahl TaxID=1610832 RepID=A0A0E3M0Y3_9CAUD|nr:tail length tape measure protein [Bacillus phage Stahl]AKA61481.1 tape measure protein [Bacillus phage Stahl]
MSDQIKISFQVDGEELKQITQAMNILDKFNKQAKTVVDGLNGMGTSMNGVGQSAKNQKNSIENLDAAMQSWSNKIKGQQKEMLQHSQTAKRMANTLNQLGSDAKVTADSAGRLSATFKDMNGNTVRMSGTVQQLNSQIGQMKTTITATSSAVTDSNKRLAAMNKEQQQLAKAMADGRSKFENQSKAVSKLAQDYDKLHTGTRDLSKVLADNKGKFDVYTNSLQKNSQIMKASIDAHGKFSQTLKNEKGELTTISGYYDKNNQRITEYNRSIVKSADAMGRASKSANRYQAELMGLNKQAKSFGESLEHSATKMVEWGAAGAVVFGIQDAFRGLGATILEVDSQMTQLRRVLDDDVDMGKLFDGAVRNASLLGIKLTDINEAMIEFGRQGFDDSQIEKLTKATGMMKNVADMDMGMASENMTAFLATFRRSVDDTMEYVDKLNEVDNKYAVSVDQLSNSIRKAGGTANAFGVSMDMVIGYTTAIGEATRESGQQIGNALKTIFSRVTTLGGAEKVLNAVGIAVKDQAGEARKAEDIFGDLHKVWGDLTNAERQNIALKVAGTHQVNRFLVMMQNYDKALKSAKTAENSWGSAQRENAKYMESLQAKLNNLWSSLQLAAVAAGDAGLTKAFKVLIETANTLVQGVLGMGKAMGDFALLLPVVATGIGLFTFNLMKVKANADLAVISLNTVGTATQQMALKMGASTTAATVLGGAVGRITGGIRAMTIALATNPFTILLAAASTIAYFVGQSKQMDDQLKSMQNGFKDSTKEFKAFQEAIANKSVDEYSVNKYKTQVDMLKDSTVLLNGVMKDGVKVYEQQNNSMVAMKAGTETMGMSQAQMKKHYAETTLARKALSEEEMTSLSTLGISIKKNTTLADVVNQVKNRQIDVKGAVKDAGEAMKKADKEAITPAIEQYGDLNDQLDKNASLMENAIGFTNKYIKSIKEQIGVVELLSGQENLSKQQKDLLEMSTRNLTEAFGDQNDTTQEVIKKAKGQVKSMDELMELSGKLADGTATNEEKKRAQYLLTQQATYENTRVAQQEANKVAKAKQQEAKEHNYTAGQAFQASIKTNKASSSISSTTTQKMGIVRGELNTTGTKHAEHAKSAQDSSKKVQLAGSEMFKASKRDFSKTRDQVDQTKKEYNKLEDEAKNIPKGIAKGIINAIADPEKAIAKLAESLVKKFKKALGIKSPSRVFMALGGHVIDGLVNGLDVDNLKSLGQNAFKDFADGAFNSMDQIKMFLSGGGPGNFKNPGGGGAGWRSMIYAAAAQMGQSVSESEVNGIIAQINRESGGNQNITQSSAVWDVNTAAGNPARGLLQYIPQTFNAYKVPGYNSIYNGYHQLLAFFNNKTWRRDLPYGRRGWGPRGGTFFANGGITGSIYQQAESNGFVPNGGFINKPHFVDGGRGIAGEAGAEAIIPLSNMRRSRALDLYSQVGNILGVHAYANGGVTKKTTTKAKQPPAAWYTVQSGNTLAGIAKLFGTSVKYLQSINKGLAKTSKDKKLTENMKVSVKGLITNDGSYRANDLLDPQRKKAGYVQAENGSWVKKTATKAPAKKPTTPAKPPAKTYATKYGHVTAIEGDYSEMMSTIGYLQNNGIYNDSQALYAMKSQVRPQTRGTQDRRAYNDAQIDIISKMDNVKKASEWFRSANLFLSGDDWKKAYNQTMEMVKANAEAKAQAENDSKLANRQATLSREQTLGLATASRTSSYLRGNIRAYSKTDEQKLAYNTAQMDVFKGMENLKTFGQWFDQAKLFGTAAEIKQIKENLTEIVRDNAIAGVTNATNAWFDTFSKRTPEVIKNLERTVNTIDSIKTAQEDAVLNSKIDSYIADRQAALGFDNRTDIEKKQSKMDSVKSQIDAAIQQNAELKFKTDSSDIDARLKQLQADKDKLNQGMKETSAYGKSKGLSDKDINDSLQLYKDQLAAIQEETTKLIQQKKDSVDMFNANETAIGSLTEEYKKLEREMQETQRQADILQKIKDKVNSIFDWDTSNVLTEKTDQFGNTVRDIEGNVQKVLDIQKAIQDITADIYSNIGNTVDEMVTEIISSQLPSIGDLMGSDNDYGAISSGINGAIDSVKPTWDATLSYMAQSTSQMFSSQNWQAVSQGWIQSMGSTIQSLQPLFEQMMVTMPETMGKMFENLPSLVSTAMQNITTGIFNTVIQILNQMVATVNQIVPAAQRIPAFESMQYATPTYTQNNDNSSTEEKKVYSADTNVVRNVTYVVQAGVVVGTQSEMKEFAMMIKELIDEEEGRGN